MPISDTDNIIDGAAKNFESKIESLEVLLHKKMEQILLSLSSKGGKVLNSKENQLFVSQIKTLTTKLLNENGFNDGVKSLLDNLDDLDANALNVQQTLNGINVNKAILNPLKKQFISSTVTSIKEAQINGRFIEPVRQLLFQTIVQGGNIGDAQKRMRDLMLGAKGEKGILSRWAGQVSRDALGQYNGLINQQIRKEHNLKGYIYVGTLVIDSRSQCSRWLNKGFIPYNELEKEINWALRNGSGMVSSTTKDSFATYRGGYNCRHEAIASNGPIEESPEDVLNKSEKFQNQVSQVKKRGLDKINDGLTITEKTSVFAYSDVTDHKELNLFLLGNLNDVSNVKREYLTSFEKVLNSALLKLPKVEDLVHRGVDLSISEIKKYQTAFNKNETITEPFFVSTSGDPGKRFTGNTIFTIRSKNGRSISNLSKFGEKEDEILFMSQTKFRVKEFFNSGGATEIVLEEI